MVREKFPDKLLVHTEGCTGLSKSNEIKDQIHNGEIYAHDIIGDLNAGTNAYIDWNIVLDSNGGPNHKKNFCNSPILLNNSQTDYIKTPAYYYIGHFSKFIKPGAKRIAFSKYTDNFEVTSFKNLDGSVVIVILNKKWFKIDYNICVNNRLIKDSIPENSIITYVVNK